MMMNRKPSSPHFIVMSLNCGKHFNDLTNSVLAFVREYFDNPTFNNTSIFYCKSMCTEESYQWIGVDVGAVSARRLVYSREGGVKGETRDSCRAEVQDEDRTRLGDDPACARERSSLRGNLLR